MHKYHMTAQFLLQWERECVCVCVYARACKCQWACLAAYVFALTYKRDLHLEEVFWSWIQRFLTGKITHHVYDDRDVLCVNKSLKVKASSTPEPQLEPVLNSGLSWVPGRCASDRRPPVSHQQSVRKPSRENLSGRQIQWDALTLFTIFHTAQWQTGSDADICSGILFCC